jgi:hypothetical protein
MEAGIDKLKISITQGKFLIQDHSIFDDIPQPGIKKGIHQEAVPMFMEGSTGQMVYGSGKTCYRNEYDSEGRFLWKLELNPKSMVIEWNPAKLTKDTGSHIHPVSDDRTLATRNDSVFQRLAELGIQADYREAKITRIDVCRNMLMNDIASAYLPCYDLIKFPRAKKDTVTYPDGVRFSTDRRTLNIYNKGREVADESIRKAFENKLLRIESQFRDFEAVKATTGIRSIKDLEDSRFGIEYQQNRWRAYLKREIFKVRAIYENQSHIPYESIHELINLSKQRFNKNFLFKALLASVPDLESHLQMIGGLKNIEKMLSECLSVPGRKKAISQIQEVMDLSRMYVHAPKSVLDMYDEFYRKSVA